MAVGSQDYVANQPIIDTYAPLPFKEMQESLNNKQLEYDTEEKKLSELPSYLKANIKPTYTDTQGKTYKNANYDKYINEASAFNNQINEASKTLSATSDPHEVKKLTSDISNRIANWKLNEVKPAEDESANYEANWKKLQEDKNKGKETYRAYKHDLAVRSQEGRDLSKGYIPVGFNDQLDYSDINKNIAEASKSVPLNETSRKSFLEHTTKNGIVGFKEWEKTNGNNSETIKSVIDPIIQEHFPHIKAELVHSLANSQYHYTDMIKKGYNPNDENSILQYAYESETNHKEGKGKEVKSNLLQDFYDKKRLEFTSAALGYTKKADKYGEKFDMSEYLTKDKKEKEVTPLDYSYSNTTPVNTTGENVIKDPTQMTFHDFMLAKGGVPTSKGYAFGHEEKGLFGLNSTSQAYARDEKPEGSTMDAWIDKLNTFLGSEGSHINEDNKRAGGLYDKYKKEYDVLQKIDSEDDSKWIKSYTSLNKPAENFYKAYEERRKQDPSLPILKSRDVYDFINNNVYKRSATNYTPILSEKQVEQKGFQLFGDENSPEVRTANKTKWVDKDSGKELDFDNIPVEGTTMKKWLSDYSDSKDLSEKKKLLKSSTNFELPYSGAGGESMTINGKTYVNGGSSIKERAAILPMSHYNTINTNPEQIYTNDGIGTKFTLYGSSGESKDRVYEDKLAPIMDKDKKSVSSHTETDLVTGKTYVIYTDRENKPVFYVPLDTYNQDAKDIIGIGTIKKEKEAYDKP